jgi:hypothetical protein
MPTCPSGHQSGSDDWCDQCGLRISGPVAPAAPPPGPPAAPAGQAAYGYPGGGPVAVETCPECGTPREAQALFCEECRFNFATHSPGSAGPPPTFPVPAPQYPPLSQRTTSSPSRINRPAESLSTSAAIRPDNSDFLLSPPATLERAPSSDQSALPPPATVPDRSGRWTAVVAADRDYFTAMMARSGPEAPGLFFPQYSPESHYPLTAEQVTIGRRRHSTGEAPDIDLSRSPEDPGVSHRHAVLARRPDGGWSVIDQDSTNGTTVNGGAEAIEPFQPIDLEDGDRVHVGAWTTITLRLG